MGTIQSALLSLLLVATATGPAEARQSRIPPPVIVGVANCLEDSMADALTSGVYTPELDDGWGIVMPVKGHPNDPGVQFAPPAADGEAMYAVQAVGSEAAIGEIDQFSDFVVRGDDGIIWEAHSVQVFWMRAKIAARDCFVEVTNGREIFPH